ncbi:MAG: ImmA/IrrE family metallo-endopeptidase [Clostridia bacterium]|nr:ImmA/IrrE family metallo-endopeptidase [Clostridia bacterium]
MKKNDIEINAEAIELRDKFGQDNFGAVDIFSMISDSDEITVVFYPMSENLSGLCIREEKNKIIGINSKLSYGRQRFTMAHELYHLYYHDRLGATLCPKDLDSKKDPIEIEANTFASYFLMPYEALRSFVTEKINKKKGELMLEDVVRIEQHFGMSRMATLWRLVKEGYLSFEDSSSMKSGIVGSALTLGYDDKLYKPTKNERQYFTLGKYIKQAGKLIDEDKISNGKYEELLLNAFRSDIVYGLEDEGEEIYD